MSIDHDAIAVPNPITETAEQSALRRLAADLGARYGMEYMREKFDAGQTTDELWSEPDGSACWGSTSPRSTAAGERG